MVSMTTVDVFVFGALMRSAPGRTNGRAASLPDHEVRFVARGVPHLEPSFAALVPAKGRKAHGVIYSLDERVGNELVRLEPGYEEQRVTVESDGTSTEALALFPTRDVLLASERIPSRRYARILVRGAREHGLPQVWIKRLQGLADQGPRLTSALSWCTRPVVRLVPVIGLPAALGLTLVVLGCAAACLLWGLSRLL